MNLPPILSAPGPFSRDIHGCEIEHFEQAVITGEHGFAFGYFPELPIKAFDGIRRVDELPDFARVLEIGGQLRPIIAPGF